MEQRRMLSARPRSVRDASLIIPRNSALPPARKYAELARRRRRAQIAARQALGEE